MTGATSIFEQDLERCAANTAPLTPLTYLRRAAGVFPDKTAVIHGTARTTYAELYARSCRLASALAKRGIGRGDTVAILAPNTPAMLEAHYGVPMAGAVLNALNFRLDPATIAFILDHGTAKVLLCDREFAATAREALALAKVKPLVVDIEDVLAPAGETIGALSYEALLAEGDPDSDAGEPADEWQSLSLLYTSGTTGNPKGVVYSHRGAHLNAFGNMITFGLRSDSVYLWTLPMFHCNGWTFTWAVTAACGTHVCLRKVEPAPVYAAIVEHGITHMCGAPVVLTILAHAPAEAKKTFPQTVEIATGGAAPPSAVIEAMEANGFRVTHLYGLTETYGPATVCAWQEGWADLSDRQRTERMARQGVRYVTMDDAMVAAPEDLAVLPRDGRTLGEIMLRGNTVMKGYYKNPAATAEAFRGGWLHTGDLAVCHTDSYMDVKDRSKDVINSGGENISSLEVEEALYRHPKVLEAAVVARPDEKWGETPCAFVTAKPGADLDEAEIIDYCRGVLARFKVPKTVIFGPLPKTSTGKIQKFVLRDQARDL
ncbi:MAG TPA: acyl-CoA synthetase [Kiloniellales bacterium]|jgi:fatty-acyl-CoA synthase